MSKQMAEPWLQFEEWQDKFDPKRELTTTESVDRYLLWKENWAFSVADEERIRQLKNRS